MDRFVEAVAAYLCRHRCVGLLRLALDLTRRRPELFAEIGAVEVVKGVVAPPTPGTDAWWRAVAAVREAVYALRGRGLAQARRRPSTGRARPADKPDAKPPTAKNGVLFRFFLVFAARRRMASRLYPTPSEMNVKRGFKPTAEPTKNQRKT